MFTKNDTTSDNTLYWATTLQEEVDDIETIRTKMYNESLSNITYDELFRLREHLAQMRSLVHLLNEDLIQEPVPNTPFWKRFFRK